MIKLVACLFPEDVPYNVAMDHYTSERLMLEAHQARVRFAEERARLFPETGRTSMRWWMAGRLRSLADRLDGRAATPTLRVVQ